MTHHHGHHHGHGHGHGHHHGSSSALMLSWSIAITLSYAIIEAIAGIHAHSLALLGDAGHMASDAFALGIALFATWLSEKPPSNSHSFGLGRAEVLAGTFSSILMFAIAISIIVESVERFRMAESINAPLVMAIGTLGMLVNFLVAYLLSKGQQTLNVRAAMLHVIGDILGSIAAITSGAVIYFKGWLAIDPIVSIFISALIGYSSIRLLREAVTILMEGVPLHINMEQIRRTMCDISSIKKVHDLHVWTLSSGNIAISAHVQLHDILEWSKTRKEAKRILEQQFGITHMTLQPESEDTTDCIHCEDKEKHA